jgi:hypothetical protein
MPSNNAKNPAKGRLFRDQARKALTKHYGVEFLIEHPIAIGNPPKVHRFDLASVDSCFVAECKCYSWTETGNTPSAKLAFCNQAVFYLSYLPRDVKKLLIMKKDTHPRREETLAQYYKRINQHLLDEITIIEFDPSLGKLGEIG